MGEWRVKYDGFCSMCGTALAKGTPAIWDRASRTIRCIECPSAATDGRAPESPEPEPSAPLPLDAGVAGRSARARHEQLAAKRDAAITERWGTGLAAKLVRTFTEEPQSTRAWAIGAAGEEALAASLAQVPGLVVLNDRRVRGTRGNIDHILVAPGGVFVVDAKANQGVVEIRDRGWFLSHDYRLTVNRRDCSAMADHMAWQVEAVLGALGTEEVAPAVTPVLCFTRAQWPMFGAPKEFRGVLLESPRSLRGAVTRSMVLTPEAIDGLARRLSTALPAK